MTTPTHHHQRRRRRRLFNSLTILKETVRVRFTFDPTCAKVRYEVENKPDEKRIENKEFKKDVELLLQKRM